MKHYLIAVFGVNIEWIAVLEVLVFTIINSMICWVLFRFIWIKKTKKLIFKDS